MSRQSRLSNAESRRVHLVEASDLARSAQRRHRSRRSRSRGHRRMQAVRRPCVKRLSPIRKPSPPSPASPSTGYSSSLSSDSSDSSSSSSSSRAVNVQAHQPPSAVAAMMSMMQFPMQQAHPFGAIPICPFFPSSCSAATNCRPVIDGRLEALLGRWEGRDGTFYEVMWDDRPRRGRTVETLAGGRGQRTLYDDTVKPWQSLTVRTRRPGGRVQCTPGLIRLEARPDVADGRAMVVWGARSQYYLEDAALPDQAIWCDIRCLRGGTPSRSITFNWSRVSALPPK